MTHKTLFRRRFQLATWLTISVLLLQLFAMEFHHHDLADIDPACASCQLDAMHPAPAPAAPAMVPVRVMTFSYYLAAQPVISAPPDVKSYLSPYPQAPPRALG